MRIKYFFILIAGVLLAATSLQAQPNDVIVRPLTGYFINKEFAPSKGMNYMVVTKEKQFNKQFGIAKTMTNKVGYPDFKKESVLVLVLPETHKETTIEFVSAVKAGNFVEVYYKVKKAYPITYSIIPQALAVVPKFPGVSTYKFYEGKKLVRTEKIK